MKYFNYINEDKLDSIFYKKPQEFDKNTEKDILKYSLGAFLYVPANKYNQIYKSILNQDKHPKPLAICLEDAIGEFGEKEAIDNLELVLDDLSKQVFYKLNKLPLIFIRVKDIDQLKRIKNILTKNRQFITGIIIPKANGVLLKAFVGILDDLGLKDMYVIPIIESSDFIYKEVKEVYFREMFTSILNHKDRVLGIRIGLTDVLGMYGIRRKREFCVYDNLIATSFIEDVVNYLNREELDIPISAGVSELFNMDDEKIKRLYIREIELDKFHGFVGKTVIHPKQIEIVQALLAVTYEDYMDAKDIIENYHSEVGVKKSCGGDKMNEYKPHYKWAKKTMSLAYIYGVLKEGVDYNELIETER
ncbi:HpcH/HpaI aldolase/citrate lyase family protein [Intestinibacter sp.]